MSHPFGDLLSQHLHQKHGLSQAKLAEGILQDPSIIGKMCKGQRLNGPQARERVLAILDWLGRQAVMTTVTEANQLLDAAGMAPLRASEPADRILHMISRTSNSACHFALAQHQVVSPDAGRVRSLQVDHIKSERIKNGNS